MISFIMERRPEVQEDVSLKETSPDDTLDPSQNVTPTINQLPSECNS